jgi:hypothetical protein
MSGRLLSHASLPFVGVPLVSRFVELDPNLGVVCDVSGAGVEQYDSVHP